MCSSLYHFGDRADEVDDPAAPRRAPRGDRLRAGAQPVAAPVVGRLAAALTDPGVGDGDGHLRRFDLETFTALVARHGGRVTHHAGDRNALAELPPLADA